MFFPLGELQTLDANPNSSPTSGDTDSNVELNDGHRDKEYAKFSPLGCLLGCFVAVILWFFPFPVALIIWLFDLKGLFADYMYLALPVFALLPIILGYLGGRIGHPTPHAR